MPTWPVFPGPPKGPREPTSPLGRMVSPHEGRLRDSLRESENAALQAWLDASEQPRSHLQDHFFLLLFLLALRLGFLFALRLAFLFVFLFALRLAFFLPRFFVAFFLPLRFAFFLPFRFVAFFLPFRFVDFLLPFLLAALRLAMRFNLHAESELTPVSLPQNHPERWLSGDTCVIHSR